MNKVIYESRTTIRHHIKFLRIVSRNDVKFQIKVEVDTIYKDQSYIEVEMYYFATGCKRLFFSYLHDFESSKVRISDYTTSDLFDIDCDRVLNICQQIING